MISRTSAALDFDFGLARLTEYDENGFVGVQIDAHAAGADSKGVALSELHHAYGFISRPLDPDVDGDGEPHLGCTMLVANEGTEKHVWLDVDQRIVPILPVLKKGSSAQYGSSGAFSLFEGEGDGSWELYVPYSFDGTPHLSTAGKAMSLRFDAVTEQITLQHGEAHTIVLTKDGDIVLAIDDSTHLTVRAGEVVVSAGQVTLTGTTLVGSPAGADFVALAALVQAALSTIATKFDAHTHLSASPGAPTGLASASTPPITMTPLGPVAATRLKTS